MKVDANAAYQQWRELTTQSANLDKPQNDNALKVENSATTDFG